MPNVSPEEIQAISVTNHKEFLAAFEARKDSLIARGNTIKREIEQHLGGSLPDSFARDVVAYHLRFLRENKANFDVYFQNREKAKADLVKSNRTSTTIDAPTHYYQDYERSDFDKLRAAQLDDMIDEYLTLFFWPHFRISALHTAYLAEAKKVGAITEEDLQKTEEATLAKLHKKIDVRLPTRSKLWGFIPTAKATHSRYSEASPTAELFSAAIQPIYEIHTLANTLLYFFDPDIKYAQAYMLAYDPRHPIVGRRRHTSPDEDFEHDFGQDYTYNEPVLGSEPYVLREKFDPKGNAESFSVKRNPRFLHPPKMGISKNDADAILKHFSGANDADRAAINAAVAATENFHKLLLTVRIGGLPNLQQLQQAADKFYSARTALINQIGQHVFSEEDRKAIPKDVLGFHLDPETGVYKTSFSSMNQFQHVFGEVKRALSEAARQL